MSDLFATFEITMKVDRRVIFKDPTLLGIMEKRENTHVVFVDVKAVTKETIPMLEQLAAKMKHDELEEKKMLDGVREVKALLLGWQRLESEEQSSSSTGSCSSSKNELPKQIRIAGEFGLTVKQLKEFIKDWPEINDSGEVNEIWVGTDAGLSSPCIEIVKLNQGDVLFEHKDSKRPLLNGADILKN